MSVLDRAALEQSPLADLHALASDLSIDGYRRLRRAELIDAILGTREEYEDVVPGGPAARRAEGSDDAGSDELEEAVVDEIRGGDDDQGARRRRGRRGGRGRGARDEDSVDEDSVDEQEGAGDEDSRGEKKSRGNKDPRGEKDGGRGEKDGGRGRSSSRDRGSTRNQDRANGKAEAGEDEIVEGIVELLPNGSGFARVHPPEPSDDDVYISSAQVKRCELVSGDQVSGPRRAPRRSERFASLVRIDTINGQPAAEIADSTRWDDLPAAFPSHRFRLGSEDPTIKAIEWLTPFGRGSRVTIVGGRGAGKTEALRRLAAALAGQEDLQITIALAGVRPEEIAEWRGQETEPASTVSFAASADAQGHAVERVVDQARRVAARGGHALVLVDTLEGMHPHAARKALAAARNIVDGGSLTVIATAGASVGGETTVIALDTSLASIGRFPALNLAESGTMRPELLVGEAGAKVIARAREEALAGDDE